MALTRRTAGFKLPNYVALRILGGVAGIGLLAIASRKKHGLLARGIRTLGYSLLMRSVGQYALTEVLGAAPQSLQTMLYPLRRMLSLEAPRPAA